MIFVRIDIIEGTNIAIAFYEMSYLANNIRCSIEAGFEEWRLLVQPQDSPKELFMVWKELMRINEKQEIEYKAMTFFSFRDLYEALSDEQKEIYTKEYDLLRGVE